MKTFSKIALIGLLFGVMGTSCKKDTCDNPVPEMGYGTFYQVIDDPTYDYRLVFNFSDCEGDIGMETTATIRDEYGDIQTTNFKLDLYYMENGEWFKYIFQSEDGLNSKIPDLSSNGVQSPIEDGEVEKKLLGAASFGGYDTIMFKSRILDNAGHYSNEVETPAFVISQ